jgi:hypothetical protein
MNSPASIGNLLNQVSDIDTSPSIDVTRSRTLVPGYGRNALAHADARLWA